MPIAIMAVALVLIAAGIRGSYKQLYSLLVGDFTGQDNFLVWLAAIACVGLLGYIPKLETFSKMFLALILVAIFVKQGTGVYDQFVNAIEGASAGAQNPNPGSLSGSSTASPSGFAGAMGAVQNFFTAAPSMLGITGGPTINPVTNPSGLGTMF